MARQHIGEAIDLNGRSVHLDEKAVHHIVDQHPEMASNLAEILGIITTPHVIQPDPWPGRMRYYRRGVGPSTWLFAVVDFEMDPPRIVTAYGRRKGP